MPLRVMLTAAETIHLQPYSAGEIDPYGVRLESLYSAISHGTELMAYSGQAPKFSYTWDTDLRQLVPRSPAKSPYPMALGYENVAKVVQVGTEASGFDLGSRYWLDAPHQTTHLLDTRTMPPHFRIPDAVSPRVFSVFALTRVALGAVHDANPLIGDIALVTGMGVVGLLTVQLLKLAGVRRVIAVDPDPSRMELAVRFGAEPVRGAQEEVAHAVKLLATEIDFAIEASGRYEALDVAVRSVRPGGRVVIVSSYGNQDAGLFLGHEFHRNRVTLLSSMTVNGCAHRAAPLWDLHRLNAESAHLLSTGALDVESLISDVMPFSSAQAAYRRLTGDRPPLKILLNYADVDGGRSL